MKIGIETKGFEDWGGGIDFIRHIASCIEIADEKNGYDKYILTSRKNLCFNLKSTRTSLRLLLTQLFQRKPLRLMPFKGFDEFHFHKTFSDFRSFTLVSLGNSLSSHLSFARKQKFGVLIPCITPLPDDYPLPWVGYLYDFQHRHLAELFSQIDIERRDAAFSSMLDKAKHVIVNSNTVKLDAEKFIGSYKAKIHVLPFSPSPREIWIRENRDLGKQYGVSEPYLIICNQFWVHKDHITAFKAFALFLRGQRKDYKLLCTGEVSDFRRPNYFRSLLGLLVELGIEKNVIILGHIPKLDQIALLKRAIAVVQPTLFEGGPGGGSAYDAISLGVPLIISDIPVNLEVIDSERVFFFKSKSVEDLAEKMRYVSETSFESIDNQVLLEQGNARKLVCGRVLLNILRQASS